MSIKLGKYVRGLTWFGLLVLAAYTLFTLLTPDRYTPVMSWLIVPFFYLVILTSRAILYYGAGKKKNRVGRSFLGITMVRFMFYVGILMAYSFTFPEEAVVFIITFFVVYFIFSLYEVTKLYRELTQNRSTEV